MFFFIIFASDFKNIDNYIHTISTKHEAKD